MNNGGQAFPCATGSDGGIFQQGMTLRDYFAGRCLTAYVHSLEQPVPDGGCAIPPKELVAQVCYEYADAMLKEREKQ